jgi:hypothetical protein
VLDGFEKSNYNIQQGFEVINSIYFKKDPCNIRSYLDFRINKNGIFGLINCSSELISPSLYVSMLNCPPTSIAVERSFSMLKKMLQKDRNFLQENIYFYFCFYFYKSINIEEDSSDIIEME